VNYINCPNDSLQGMIKDAVLYVACKRTIYSDKLVIYLGFNMARKGKMKLY